MSKIFHLQIHLRKAKDRNSSLVFCDFSKQPISSVKNVLESIVIV